MLGHGHGKLAPQKITMAMAVEWKNRHYHRERFKVRHWIETAKRCGVAEMNEIVGDSLQLSRACETISKLYLRC